MPFTLDPFNTLTVTRLWASVGTVVVVVGLLGRVVVVVVVVGGAVPMALNAAIMFWA
jgi:hypothetical protein